MTYLCFLINSFMKVTEVISNFPHELSGDQKRSVALTSHQAKQEGCKQRLHRPADPRSCGVVSSIDAHETEIDEVIKATGSVAVSDAAAEALRRQSDELRKRNALLRVTKAREHLTKAQQSQSELQNKNT